MALTFGPSARKRHERRRVPQTCRPVSVSAAILAGVSATYSLDEGSGDEQSLRKGASPRAIRSALLPGDQAAFDAAYADALAEARTSLDLTDLFAMLERWRPLALLQQDPARFRAVARRAAELLTGRPCPDDEPLAVTRAKAGI